MMGCDSTDTTGPTTWTSDDLTIVGTDECNFFIEDTEYVAVITVTGTSATMVLSDVANPDQMVEMFTDNYDPMADEIRLTGVAISDNPERAPCIVELDDAIVLTLDDTDVSLEENSSLSATWDHAEEDVSVAYDNACTLDSEGNPLELILWFNDLPCAGESALTFTLVQQTEE